MACASKMELVRAYRVLFRTRLAPGSEALERLQLRTLKQAFRRRSLESHPDRAGLLGRSERQLTEEFQQVGQAYASLCRFVEGRVNRLPPRAPTPPRRSPCPATPQPEGRSPSPATPQPEGRSPSPATPRPKGRGPSPATPQPEGRCPSPATPQPEGRSPSPASPRPEGRSPCPATPPTPGELFWRAGIPLRELQLGQFLYYSGSISWQMLAAALSWQRAQRPRIGQIALAWRMLDAEQIRQLLQLRRFGEPFGEAALRLGYLDRFQWLALLGQQRRLQRPLGEYFVERGLLDTTQLQHGLQAQRQHNAGCALVGGARGRCVHDRGRGSPGKAPATR